jgi:hypothetical protein
MDMAISRAGGRDSGKVRKEMQGSYLLNKHGRREDDAKIFSIKERLALGKSTTQEPQIMVRAL